MSIDVLMLAPVYPFAEDNGHKIAVMSDVHAVLANGLRLALFAFWHHGQTEPSPGDADFPVQVVPVRKGSRPVRFLRSLTSAFPPSVERLYSRHARQALACFARKTKPRLVIVNDFCLGGYIPLLREAAPGARIAARSHNVMADVCSHQLRGAPRRMKPVFALETSRWRRLEGGTLRTADCCWAITANDALRLRQIYGGPGVGYLPVSIKLEKYLAVPLAAGDDRTLVHLGTTDVRKYPDFLYFLRTTWPRLREAGADMRLILGGRFEGVRQLPADGVEYRGYVEDDASLFARGRYALNLQTSTGGIKLKSLTAMAAGRTLVSTTIGVEGIDIQPGMHYWNLEQMIAGGAVPWLSHDGAAPLEVARRGREWVSENHCAARVGRQFAALLEHLSGQRS